MGILRADRVSGLGGANAINGSVFFDGATIITVNDSDDFHYGTGDFTVEGWIYATGRDQQMMLIGQWDGNAGASGTVAWALQLTNDTNGYLRFLISTDTSSVGFNQNASSGSVFDNSWHHFAVTRSGNDYKFFLDGTVVKSFTDSAAIGNATVPLTIGGSSRAYTGGTAPNQMFTGYLSNIRITKGEAVYTAAFTAPTNRLEKTVNTVLLCCQSPGYILKEEVGKVLGVNVTNTNNKGPSASNFAPDVGEDHGITFTDNTKFDTLSYMVPPGGTTIQSNRGRGVLGGGAPFVSPNVINNMQYIEIQSGGIFKDFGDLTVARGYFPAGHTSSSTRGLNAGGWTGSDNNTIDYITIATTSNATEFGDTSVVRPSGGLSNQTRSVNGGDAALTNTIDYVTIATTGNASDFGDLTEGRGYVAGVASPTRGVFGGGRNNTPSSNTLKNTMEYITIATTGNTTDFGDLQALRYGHTAFSSSVRGIWAGGYLTPGQTATIDYFTIATLGNSADFGDLSINNGYCGSVTNSIRGAVTINDAPNYTNALEYITIATLGNAKDFGDSDPTGSGKGHGDFPSSMSDSHGGVA